MTTRHFVFIVVVFLAYLSFSITSEFWYPDEDVLQIYLIGLKFYTTGQFPYFGPDLVYTHAQIPGALQAFLVSAPWFVIRIPEAPHVLLNLLLVSSMVLLGYYLQRRLPEFPKTYLWLWLFLSSWPILYCTRIINPSYVVPGAIVFWIGLYESLPGLTKNIMRPKWSFFMMGSSLFWIVQLHASWVLLVPFIAYAFLKLLLGGNMRNTAQAFLFFFLGSLVSASTLIPTLLKFGLSNESGISPVSVVQMNVEHLSRVFEYLSKYVAYASFDITRFIGKDTALRLAFLREFWWAAPFAVIVTIFGVLQGIFLVVHSFNRKNDGFQWNNVRLLTLGTFIMMWASSLFSMATPGGHATVLLYPAISIYAAYVFSHYLRKEWVRVLSMIVFSSCVILYFAIATSNYEKVSLYKNRGAIQKALESSNYREVGNRRYEK